LLTNNADVQLVKWELVRIRRILFPLIEYYNNIKKKDEYLRSRYYYTQVKQNSVNDVKNVMQIPLCFKKNILS